MADKNLKLRRLRAGRWGVGFTGIYVVRWPESGWRVETSWAVVSRWLNEHREFADAVYKTRREAHRAAIAMIALAPPPPVPGILPVPLIRDRDGYRSGCGRVRVQRVDADERWLLVGTEYPFGDDRTLTAKTLADAASRARSMIESMDCWVSVPG